MQIGSWQFNVAANAQALLSFCHRSATNHAASRKEEGKKRGQVLFHHRFGLFTSENITFLVEAPL